MSIYLDRHMRVYAAMKREGVSDLIIAHTANIKYLTGLSIFPGQRLNVLIMSLDKNPVLVLNRLIILPEQNTADVDTYGDWEDGVVKVSGHINKNARVGIDKSWQFGFANALAAIRPDIKLADGSACIDRVRAVKDDQEIELMRISSKMNDEVMGGLIKCVRPGISELELAENLYEICESAGNDGYHGGANIAFGDNALDGDHAVDKTVLRTGDNILIDIGFSYHGYWSDMTRTVFFREVSDELRNIYDVVIRAQVAAINAVRPGIQACEIDKIARSIINEAGYKEFLNHRIGHCIGSELHESPDICSNVMIPLEKGMVFSVEPGIYKPGVGGVRIEDLILVTENGYENLNHYPKDFTIV